MARLVFPRGRDRDVRVRRPHHRCFCSWPRRRITPAGRIDVEDFLAPSDTYGHKHNVVECLELLRSVRFAGLIDVVIQRGLDRPTGPAYPNARWTGRVL